MATKIVGMNKKKLGMIFLFHAEFFSKSSGTFSESLFYWQISTP